MLLSLTKTNSVSTNDKQIFLNIQTIIYFSKFSKEDDSGSEISLIGGAVIHVKERPDEITTMMMKEMKENALARKKPTATRTAQSRKSQKKSVVKTSQGEKRLRTRGSNNGKFQKVIA